MNSNGYFQITLKVLLWDKDFFLYLKDAISGKGDLPGGRITRNEFFDWHAGLKRELEEELGRELQFEISPLPGFCFPHYIEKDKNHAVVVLFEGQYLGGKIQISGEHVSYDWLHKDADLGKYFSDTFLKGLEHFFRSKKKAP